MMVFINKELISSMNQSIRNIYCVGRNFKLHAAELGNELPKEPLIFTKPTHAIAAMNVEGTTVRLPAGSGQIHYEGELVLHIGNAYKPGATVDELVDGFALGLDMTLRDVQSEIKKQGYPWLAAKGFLNSALLTPMQPFPGAAEIEAAGSFQTLKNGSVVQQGHLKDLIFGLQVMVDFIGSRYGLGAGDLIYTGTPAGVGPVQHGDMFELCWHGQSWGKVTFHI
jgi:fumarylpyruvate hydrolase